MHPDLVAKYRNQRVPRYTSYPASPHFTPEIGTEDYRSWLVDLPTGGALSLYVHVPFCRSMCWYCGCHTMVVKHDEPLKAYVAALMLEAATVAAHVPVGLKTTHLHFGGGTPSLLPPDLFAELVAGLRTIFRFDPAAELAIEIDPRTLDPNFPRVMARAGINRASLGVQSFDPAVQAAVNRVQTFEETADAVDHLRAAGIDGINLDLVYGLPRQTKGSCIETVRLALSLEPDRLSVFGYAHMPGFKAHQARIDEADLPGPDERLVQAIAIEQQLLAAGYVAIGLDHFAKPDDPLAKAFKAGQLKRNFQGYTTDSADVLIGLGASAIGRLPQGFVANTLAVPAYQKAVLETGMATARGFLLSEEDRLRGAVIERLMCSFEVDFSQLADAFGRDAAAVLPSMDALDRLERDGLIQRDGSRLRVREEAKPLVRSVAALFDAYLEDDGTRHSRAI